MSPLKRLVHISVIFLSAITFDALAESYEETAQDGGKEGDNLYSNQQTNYHQLKEAKQYIYKTFPVYVDPSPGASGQGEETDNLEKVHSQLTDADYGGDQYYPQSYYVDKGTPISKEYLPPPTGGVTDVHHLSMDEKKKYKFGYRVSDSHTGTEFGHSETSDGHTAKGHYHVLLPDGRMQNVKYWASESGFHAVVTYDK